MSGEGIINQRTTLTYLKANNTSKGKGTIDQRGYPEGVNNRSKGMKRSIDQREYMGGMLYQGTVSKQGVIHNRSKNG